MEHCRREVMQKIAFLNAGGSHTKREEAVRQLAVDIDNLHAQHWSKKVTLLAQVGRLKNFDN